MSAQVKSRARVQDHGEVFTNEREVNAMLDMVKQETERIDSRFIRRCIRSGLFDYDKKTYARIIGTLKFHEDSGSDGIVVKSIEAVKGLEHRRCLFILTNDLVPYLLGEKTEENKTKHLLYVALTRSLDNLTILVASNVETRYPRERILAALNADE